jgi:glutaredoxin
MKRLVLAAVILGCIAGTASAQLYKWTDENGRTRYTDTPPPPNAKGAQKKNYNSGASESAVPYATQRAIREFPVVLYTAPDCGKPCVDGRALLERRGVPYREIATRDAADIEGMKKATGQNQVPALLVGPEAIGGYEAGRWNAALNLAGYPSSAVKPQAARAPADGPLPGVKLYTNSECNEVCEAARGYLVGRNVRFQEVRVEDEASLAELKKVSGGLSVPVLIVGSAVQKGFELATYQRLLDAAGFPKTK